MQYYQSGLPYSTNHSQPVPSLFQYAKFYQKLHPTKYVVKD